MRRLLFVTTLFFIATSAAAADLERVLLPISIDTTPGANGSLWTSDLWVDITTDAGVQILPLAVTDGGLLRRQTLRLPVFRAPVGQPPGHFIRVTRDLLDDVHFNLRIRDLSRQAETFGTEVPVVRESEFRAGPISIVPVPATSGFRSTIRVYAANREGGEVRVRVIGIDSDGGFLQDRREWASVTVRLEPTTSELLPPYAQLSLEGLLANENLPDRNILMRVVVEPLAPAIRVWAFASTTHNETQHVTLMTPQ